LTCGINNSQEKIIALARKTAGEVNGEDIVFTGKSLNFDFLNHEIREICERNKWKVSNLLSPRAKNGDK